jgi:hypothetical protein
LFRFICCVSQYVLFFALNKPAYLICPPVSDSIKHCVIVYPGCCDRTCPADPGFFSLIYAALHEFRRVCQSRPLVLQPYIENLGCEPCDMSLPCCAWLRCVLRPFATSFEAFAFRVTRSAKKSQFEWGSPCTSRRIEKNDHRCRAENRVWLPCRGCVPRYSPWGIPMVHL